MQTQLPDPGGQPTEPGAHVKWASETCEPAQTRRCECQGMDQYSLKSSLLPFIIIYNEQHLFFSRSALFKPPNPGVEVENIEPNCAGGSDGASTYS